MDLSIAKAIEYAGINMDTGPGVLVSLISFSSFQQFSWPTNLVFSCNDFNVWEGEHKKPCLHREQLLILIKCSDCQASYIGETGGKP